MSLHDMTASQLRAATGRQLRRLRTVDIAELLQTDLGTRENLLAPWLPKGGITMLYGPRGEGKTFLAMSIGWAITSGGRFLRWEAPAPAGVLLLDGEMPATVMRERVARLASAAQKQPAAKFEIITPDLQPEGMPDLSQPDDQDALEQHLEGIDLIIVDNISSLVRTGVENEAESWLPVQQWALAQRSAGRSVLFIHHAGRNGQARGSSRREDVMDTIIKLQRPSDYSPQEGARVEIHFDKHRGFFGKDAEAFEAQLSEDERGELTWTMQTLEDRTADRVQRLYADGLTPTQIAKELGISKSTVSYHLNRGRS